MTPELRTVSSEVLTLLEHVDERALERLVTALEPADRTWFCTGQGRSGLVAQMCAMRLMHLGRRVHAVGEATAPSIRRGDGLLVLSASGETPSTISFAQVASAQGALVVLVTATPSSSLTPLADTVVTLPVATTRQFAGSLFEQACLVVLDAVVLTLTAGDPDVYRDMRERHTNLQ